jgi:acyl-CoA synthetase (AMP-forming)/AMP-acid ligase II
MTAFGDRVRTFAEAEDRVARFAAGLRGLGVSSGDRVGLLALNSDRYIESIMAVPWADAVLNPLNTRWSTDEIAYAVDDSGTAVLVADEAFAEMATALVARCGTLHTLVWSGDGPTPDGFVSMEDVIASSSPMEDVRRGGDALAGIFYTGGTTGVAKGVMLSHANIMTSAFGRASTAPSVTEDGTCLLAAPLFHIAAFALSMGSFLAGQTQVVLAAFEPGAVLDAVEEHRIDDIVLVPTMIQMVLDHPTMPGRDLTSIKNLVYGASPISEALLDRVTELMPGARLQQGYGMTELSPIATILRPEDHSPASRAAGRLRSAGRATFNAEVRIVDPDDNEVARGEVGEIVVRGGNVMLGYWNKPEETARALRGGWMHTGDVGYMDDEGYVFLVDRLKDMIITGAENVYSTEVENAVASHPAVAACAVVGVPDDEWGERVHAFVVLRPGSSLDIAELRAHCKERIAGYKCPRSMDVIEALPLSSAGKVLKNELREPYWQGRNRSVG